MKQLLCFILVFLLLQTDISAQPGKADIEQTITKFFDGISTIDADKLRAHTTAGFTLLEDGLVWNLDTLINNLMPRKNLGIKRVNRFQFITTEREGNTAWVSYHNTADFSLNEKQQTRKWLESAVLKKEKGSWKIHLLHSTKIALPKN